MHNIQLNLHSASMESTGTKYEYHQEQNKEKVLSPSGLFPISTHFTTPSEIPSAPTILQLGSFHCLSRVEPWDLKADLKSHPQTPYISSFLLLREKKFTTRGPSTSTRYCFVRLSPIEKNSPLLPPVGVWAVSQSQCGSSSSRTTY
ncbi:hypothetical protein R6Q57_018515 [Mikania cordata]